MNHITPEIKARVVAKIAQCLEIAHRKFAGHTFRSPTYDFTLRGTTAGIAECHKWHMKFNAILLNENVDDFIARTVPHEIAHLIDYQVYQKDAWANARSAYNFFSRRRQKREVHGPTWKSIMTLFGAPTSRCHSYDVSNARVKNRRNRVTYVCGGCGKSYDVGPKHHNAILLGGRVWCRICKTTLTSAMRVDNIISALPKAAQAVAPPPTPKPSRPGTKMDHAIQVVSTHKNVPSEQVIEILRKDLGMSLAGARTYYYSARKRV